MQPLVVQPARMTVSTPRKRRSRSRLVPKKALAYFFSMTLSPGSGCNSLVDLDQRRALLQDRERGHFFDEYAGVVQILGIGDRGVHDRQLAAPERLLKLARRVDLPSEIAAERRRRIGEGFDKIDHQQARGCGRNRTGRRSPCARSPLAFAPPVAHRRPPIYAHKHGVVHGLIVNDLQQKQGRGCGASCRCASTWDCSITYVRSLPVERPASFNNILA